MPASGPVERMTGDSVLANDWSAEIRVLQTADRSGMTRSALVCRELDSFFLHLLSREQKFSRRGKFIEIPYCCVRLHGDRNQRF